MVWERSYRLYESVEANATDRWTDRSFKTEADFLEVLRGCGDDEVKYRNVYRTTVLMRIAEYHDWPEAAAAVIERGYDVNATSGRGETALHFAHFRAQGGVCRVVG